MRTLTATPLAERVPAFRVARQMLGPVLAAATTLLQSIGDPAYDPALEALVAALDTAATTSGGPILAPFPADTLPGYAAVITRLARDAVHAFAAAPTDPRLGRELGRELGAMALVLEAIETSLGTDYLARPVELPSAARPG